MLALEAKGLGRVFKSPVKAGGLAASVKQLFKPEYKVFDAVKDVTFQIAPGELVGFLGPNGAGKTTTIKMLTGIIKATSGTASVLGYEPFKRDPELLRQIALVAGNRQQLWWDLPAIDSFDVLCEIYEIDKADYRARRDMLVEGLDLTDKVNTQVRKLSLGERMKCELVAAMLHRPRVLFLDEPTIGLDILSQQRIRAFLKQFNEQEGCTMLLTSHYMQDVEALCERVVVIDHGSVAYDGTLADLKTRFANERRVKLTFREVPELAKLQAVPGFVSFEEDCAAFRVSPDDVARFCGEALATFQVADLNVTEPEVEDVIAKLFTLSPGSVSRETPTVDSRSSLQYRKTDDGTTEDEHRL
ncbi:MAG: ATP-binding cassette domain-containing protein [Armatimonadota bacterium]